MANRSEAYGSEGRQVWNGDAPSVARPPSELHNALDEALAQVEGRMLQVSKLMDGLGRSAGVPEQMEKSPYRTIDGTGAIEKARLLGHRLNALDGMLMELGQVLGDVGRL